MTQSRRSTAALVASGARALMYLLPVAFFGLFYFYPMAAILREGLVTDGSVNLSAFVETLTAPRFWRVLWFTIWQAVLSTLLTLILALPAAYAMARLRFRGKGLLRAIATVPFVLPTVVLAVAFLALLGPRGMLNQWLAPLGLQIDLSYSVTIIILAHIFYNYAIALRMISIYWQNMSPDLPEAAALLGASPWKTLFTVTLPMLRPALIAAAVLVFIFCFTSFGVIIILGGPRFATLEVEIYRQAVNLFNLPAAAVLSLWQIVFTFIFLLFYTRTQARLARPSRLHAPQSIERLPRTNWEKLLVVGTALFIVVFIGAPLVALVVRSLTGPTGLTLAFYRALFENQGDSLFYVPPLAAIRNSIVFAALAMTAAVVLGLISANLITRPERLGSAGSRGAASRLSILLDPLLMLPLATSAVTLGLGFIIAFARPPLQLRTSILLVPIAQTLVALPFVLRSLLPAIRAVTPSLREAANTLGASRWRIWRTVDWPLIRPALLVGAVFAFTISLGEFGATVLVARPETPTLPVAIFRFLGQPGVLNYGQALAMSTILMLVCVMGFLLIEHFRVGDEGEF